MTPEQFIYWLNGFMEIADPKTMDEKQVQILKDHIALVLKKETPNSSFSIPITVDSALPPGTIKFGPGNKCIICNKDHHGLACPSLAITC